MGRFVTKVPASPQQSQFTNQNASLPSDWPTVFPKVTIGLEREGVIIKDIGEPIKDNSQIEIIPGSLEAIRMMRLKGYKVMIINDQPGITKGKISQIDVDSTHQFLMQAFGQARILTIDGMLYSTSDLKEDIYAKPNDGMFKKAQNEFDINWKGGYFVGPNFKDLKVANKIDLIPVLVKTGNYEPVLKKLDTFANRDLMKKVKIYENLLEFAQTLE
jgi:D-glycero-D-manno-heptose 1,7-bisphosphate phosphatase